MHTTGAVVGGMRFYALLGNASVAGVASNDLWAVGGRGDGSACCPAQSLIEHWNGTSWSVVAKPGVNDLSGVTALAANNVWAVAVHTSPNVSTIVEHWNGTRWANVAAPSQNVNGGFISLRGIASNDVWAVDGSGLMQTQHWDGSAWSIIATPNPPVGSGLLGVAAVSSGNVWAEGYNDDSNGHLHPLIEHFTQA